MIDWLIDWKIPLCRKCFAIRILGKQNCSDVVQIRLTMRNDSGIKRHNRLYYFPFDETWLTVVTWRRQCFPQFELSFSLKVKYQFTFQSSLFIFLVDNRQKHRVSLKKCTPNTQTYALMSRYLRCVIMSHRVSRGGIESNCFRVHLQYLLRGP